MNRQTDSRFSPPPRTSMERRNGRELVATRMFDALPSAVYEAWTQPELFQRWWVPRSVPGMSLVSCVLDLRTDGRYRLEFAIGPSETIAFYGKYLDVVPNERIAWTNEEGEEGPVTTVTFEGRDGRTLLTFHEIYPTEQGLEEAWLGSAAALPEQLQQLADMLPGSGK